MKDERCYVEGNGSLIETVECFKTRNDYYHERVRAGEICRTWENGIIVKTTVVVLKSNKSDVGTKRIKQV